MMQEQWKNSLIHVQPRDPSGEPRAGWPGVDAENSTYFYGLALCGESGELANLLKKAWRGDDLPDSWFGDVCNEIADVRVYLDRIAESLGVDVDVCVIGKLPELKARGFAQ